MGKLIWLSISIATLLVEDNFWQCFILSTKNGIWESFELPSTRQLMQVDRDGTIRLDEDSDKDNMQSSFHVTLMPYTDGFKRYFALVCHCPIRANGRKVVGCIRVPGFLQYRLWLVVICGFGKEPIMLLTNLPSGGELVLQRAANYLCRWRCEEEIRFLKQGFDLEDVRVLKYVRLRNIMAFAVIAIGFLSRVGADASWGLRGD